DSTKRRRIEIVHNQWVSRAYIFKQIWRNIGIRLEDLVELLQVILNLGIFAAPPAIFQVDFDQLTYEDGPTFGLNISDEINDVWSVPVLPSRIKLISDLINPFGESLVVHGRNHTPSSSRSGARSQCSAFAGN